MYEYANYNNSTKKCKATNDVIHSFSLWLSFVDDLENQHQLKKLFKQ